MSNVNSKPEKSRSAYELALAHYEFVSKEFTEYFGMYMRSWSIAGSVVLVGAIFGLAKVDAQDGGILTGVLICIIPLALAMWFVVTSWFWAYFAMYRKYLQGLETSMSQLSGPASDCVKFHSYREPWFSWEVQRPATYLVSALAGLVYSGLALAGSRHVVAAILERQTYWWWLVVLVYVFILAGSVWSVSRLIGRTPGYAGERSSTGDTDSGRSRLQ